jgi:uncharacterized protein
VNPPWLRQDGADVLLALHVQPGAKKTEVAGQHGEALKIRLAAPPVDGKANDCLIAFLATRLGRPRAAVTLQAGVASRQKRLRIHNASATEVLASLV